jgi:hypothetical protein
MSEETPVMITVVSGGESTIDLLEPGRYLVQIQNVTPNATVLSQNRSVQIPLSYAFPSNFSTAVMNNMDTNGEEKTFLVRANDIRFIEENQSLAFEILPQEFSESTLPVPDQTTIQEIIPGLYSQANISFEFIISAAENTPLYHCCTFDQIDNYKCVPMRPMCGY